MCRRVRTCAWALRQAPKTAAAIVQAAATGKPACLHPGIKMNQCQDATVHSLKHINVKVSFWRTRSQYSCREVHALNSAYLLMTMISWTLK